MKPSRSRDVVAAVVRLLLAAASLAAVVSQLAEAVRIDFGLVNFFSYFTTLGNLFGSVVFVIGAVRLLRGTPSTSAWEAVRGSSVVYLAFVGIVFNTLLSNADIGLAPWVNVVHHMVMPAAVVVDWLLLPPERRVALRTALVWVVVPVAYTLYSVIRGAVVGFYCYPFFNPAKVGGYGGVTLYCFVLLVAFVVLALLVRLRARGAATR